MKFDLNMGNVGESKDLKFEDYYSNTETMDAFDALPMPVRRALADAPYHISVTDITKVWRQMSGFPYYWSAEEMARDMVHNFCAMVRDDSITGAEENGRYWFKKGLTKKPRRAMLRSAYAMRTPRRMP